MPSFLRHGSQKWQPTSKGGAQRSTPPNVHTLHVAFYTEFCWPEWTEITVCDFQGYVIKGIAASVLVSWISQSGEANRHVWGHSIRPEKELRPPTNSPTCLSTMQVDQLGNGSGSQTSLLLTAAPAFIWLQPHGKPWARATQRGCFQIPSPQEMINDFAVLSQYVMVDLFHSCR